MVIGNERLGASDEGRTYPRDGGVVESDWDERGAAWGLGGQGEGQPQKEGEGGQHLLAVQEDAPALPGCCSALSLI